MRERRPHEIEEARSQPSVVGGNLNTPNMVVELLHTIDDASARIANAMPDGDNVAKAINDLEARLESIEDTLNRLLSAVKEMGPV